MRLRLEKELASPAEQVLFIGSRGSLLARDRRGASLWDVGGRHVLRLETRRDEIIRVATNAPGSRLALTENRLLVLWDLEQRRELWRWRCSDRPQMTFVEVWDATFRADGRHLAVAAGQSVRLFDVARGRQVLRRELSCDSVLSVAYSPDGEHLAAGDGVAQLRLWRTAGMGLLRTFATPHVYGVWMIRFDPRGGRVATAGEGPVCLWDIGSGREPVQRLGTGPVSSLAFGPDGGWLASVEQGALHLWDLERGAHSVQANDAVVDVAISPDGRWLATAGGDRVVIWRVER